MNELAPLLLQPQASRQLAAYIVLVHAFVAGVVCVLPEFVGWLKCPLVLLIAYSAWQAWRLHISRQHSKAVQEVQLYRRDNCLVRTAQHSTFVQVCASSFFHPRLCILRLRSQAGQRFTVILLPDAIDHDILRQLRVRMRFAA